MAVMSAQLVSMRQRELKFVRSVQLVPFHQQARQIAAIVESILTATPSRHHPALRARPIFSVLVEQSLAPVAQREPPALIRRPVALAALLGKLILTHVKMPERASLANLESYSKTTPV